jgi:Acyl-CoA dehydrogenase, C-terminal domain
VCKLFIFMGKTDPDNPDRHASRLRRAGFVRAEFITASARSPGGGGAGEDVTEIAMIKVAAPNILCRVLDFAIEAHGGAGATEDFGLADAYASARVLRIVDGADEVHRNELRTPRLGGDAGRAAMHEFRLNALILDAAILCRLALNVGPARPQPQQPGRAGNSEA